MHVLIAGGSGFLGTHLRARLTERGHTVTSLVRRRPEDSSQVQWDPYAGTDGDLPQDVVAAADVVINLAGSPTVGNPHSKKWARELRESRVRTTTVLARAIARVADGDADGARADDARGELPAYLAGNGISYYGDHGDAVLSEESDTRGHALLTEVAREWQDAARPAVEAGARVCFLRTSPVMDADAPPLKQLRLLFKLGGGAKLGNGRQYMPMSSLRDWVGAVTHLAEHETASGPFNICLPTPPTNAEFTEALAAAVHRPAFLPAPAALIRIGAGELAPDLLDSVRVRPAALEAAGFTFLDPDVRSCIRTALA